MAEPFDAFQYLRHLGRRWRFIALACGAALVVSAAVSLLLPRQFTATCKILIEPPAGMDPRSAIAVSPIYLESLRTYEHFAEGDSLFQRAVAKFPLRAQAGDISIESLKKRVLEVEIPKNTKILQVEATLPDPRMAHEVALFIAAETVELNRTIAREGDRDLFAEVEKQQQTSQSRLLEVESAWKQLAEREPVADLEYELEHLSNLRSRLQRQRLAADVEAAEWTERERSLAQAGSAAASKDELARAKVYRKEASVRSETLAEQIREIEADAGRKQALLASRTARREQLAAERKAAQAELLAARTRLSEARGASGYRGERLKVIDSGIVPERPSWPNTPLNVLAALLLALVFSVLYLTMEFSYWQREAFVHRTRLRFAGKGGDD